MNSVNMAPEQQQKLRDFIRSTEEQPAAWDSNAVWQHLDINKGTKASNKTYLYAAACALVILLAGSAAYFGLTAKPATLNSARSKPAPKLNQTSPENQPQEGMQVIPVSKPFPTLSPVRTKAIAPLTSAELTRAGLPEVPDTLYATQIPPSRTIRPVIGKIRTLPEQHPDRIKISVGVPPEENLVTTREHATLRKKIN